MKEKLQSTWKPDGRFDLIYVSHGYFMVNFDLDADREKETNRGAWMIFYHYVTIWPWVPEFVVSTATTNKNLVLVRF